MYAQHPPQGKSNQGRWRAIGAFALFALLTSALLVTLATPGIGQEQTQGRRIPRELALAEAQWPLANKDYENTRATTDSPITSENVDTLGLAWSFTPQTAAGNQTGGQNQTPDTGAWSVQVQAQDASGMMVTVPMVTASDMGWLVIHEEENGTFGRIIGYTEIREGTSTDLMVQLQEEPQADALYAMLHYDRGQVGTFEFPGADGPVMMDGEIVMERFAIQGQATGGNQTNETNGQGGNQTGSDQYEEETAGQSAAAQTPFGLFTTNPIVLGNDVYVQDSYANLYVLDRQTGDLQWSKDYNTPILGPYGPAVGYGRVFLQPDQYSVAALDSSNGDQLWRTNISPMNTTGLDIPLTVFDGHVYTSTVPGVGNIFYQPGAYGVLYGLDAQTGRSRWSFSTVQGGRSLWGAPEVNSGGGAWFPPAIDTRTGTTYWAIGNPAPFPGTEEFPSGESFDEALYTDSLLAVSHRTGDLQWYTQVLAHDIWDHDFQCSPILASTSVMGTEQDVIIGAGKMGNVYCFERETGDILWVTPVGEHKNDYLDPITEPTTVLPGVAGGVETCMAYHDGIVYVPVINMETTFDPTGLNFSEPIDFNAGTGELVAIDVKYGHILWEQNLSAINVGAATVVNDVVFTATFDGMIYAFNATTGEELFTYQAPAGINGWPAVAGDTIIWPCGVGGTPSVIALKLGEAQPTQPTEPTAASITITEPQEGATVTGPSVTISVDVTNFELVEMLGEDTVEGQGHIHYFMDVMPPTTPGEPAITEPGTYAATANMSYTWSNVTEGQHTFYALLANNDHTAVQPPVWDSVNVTVGTTTGNQTGNQTGNGTGEPVEVSLTAQNLAFDQSTITVPAGAEVVMTFTNMDTGIPHNFAVYESSAADQSIFVGEIIDSGTTTYRFTAPQEPGTYFFRCDVHPTTMTGSFVVS